MGFHTTLPAANSLGCLDFQVLTVIQGIVSLYMLSPQHDAPLKPCFFFPMAPSSDEEPPTSKRLRENNPERADGISSLNLLRPGDPVHTKNASSSSLLTEDESTTEVDYNSLSPLFPTKSNSGKSYGSTDDGYASGSTSGKGKARSDSSEASEPIGADVDLGPFAFQPRTLAGLVDPKSLESLELMGGEEGLMKGLGTHPTKGLSRRCYSSSEANDSPDERSDGEDVPDIMVTSADGDEGQQAGGDLDPFSATVQLRRRVYGENVLPTRKSTTLLQLMWMALQDKVLVRIQLNPSKFRLKSLRSCFLSQLLSHLLLD